MNNYKQNLCVFPVYGYNIRSEFDSRLTSLYSIPFLEAGRETGHTVVEFIGVAKLEIFSFIDGKKAYFH